MVECNRNKYNKINEVQLAVSNCGQMHTENLISTATAVPCCLFLASEDSIYTMADRTGLSWTERKYSNWEKF